MSWKKRKKSIMSARLHILIIIKKTTILAIALSQKLISIFANFILMTNNNKEIIRVSCIYYLI